MARSLEKSLFFPGGTIVFPASNDNHKGLRLSKIDDKNWQLTLDLIIPEAETVNVIREFGDFDKVVPPATFETTYPNQVFFEAFDDNKNSIDIPLFNVELNIYNSHKNEAGGRIVLSMTPAEGVGKTQNGDTKTQNPST